MVEQPVSERVGLGHDTRIALVGCGKMGLAILRGWLARGVDPSRIQVVETHPSKALTDLAAVLGFPVLTDPRGASPADVVVIAVKPQSVAGMAGECRGVLAPGAVLVSIMAGITLETLRRLFPDARSVVRTMPNLAEMVGRSATVLVAEDDCPEAHRRLADALMGSVGSTQWLPSEEMVDAACAVSGSGPAYVFHMVECLAAAGEAEGLPPDVAASLARATLIGAGATLEDGTTDPRSLREQVTSPGGTTQAGLAILMTHDALGDVMRRTVAAAARRSRELGRSA